MKEKIDSRLRGNDTALFVGRFQPFHLGHLDAVKQILRMHKKVIIGIGSSQYAGQPKNPFPFTIRKKMIVSSLRAAAIPHKSFTIIAIPDINNDAKWVAHVEKCSSRFGTIWSGTPKVQRLFKKDGKHPVNAPKMNLEISGTLIRRRMKIKKPFSHFLPFAAFTILKNYVY